MNTYKILSDSLKEILNDIVEKENDPIAKEILYADKLLEEYCWIVNHSFDASSEIIKKVLEDTITDEVRMLSSRISDNDFEVSFLPGDKAPEYSGPNTWSRKNRQSGKPGKIFQKLLKKKFKTVEWEIFVNRFKAHKCCFGFELVEGEEIRFWYDESNYYECSGTLGNSCMRYPECSSYFDIYVDKAKMLITRKNGLLTGRAIVWELPDGTVLMDRIYTCYDYLTNCFIEYAKDHKWWIREDNRMLCSGSNQHWLDPSTDYKVSSVCDFKIKVDRTYCDFPYMDSFRYYDRKNGYFISNCDESDFYYTCDCTDGNYSESETWVCPECGAVHYGNEDDGPDDMVWSEYSSDYYCNDCVWWCDYLSDYIPNSINSEIVYDSNGSTYLLPEDEVSATYVTDPNGEDESIHDIVMVDDKYYFVQGLLWNEDTKKYELQSNSD